MGLKIELVGHMLVYLVREWVINSLHAYVCVHCNQLQWEQPIHGWARLSGVIKK